MNWLAVVACPCSCGQDHGYQDVVIFGDAAEDVRCVSARYWQFHTDPLLAVDGSVGTLLTIHFNLCIGTVAMFVSERPDLAESLDQLLRFELS